MHDNSPCELWGHSLHRRQYFFPPILTKSLLCLHRHCEAHKSLRVFFEDMAEIEILREFLQFCQSQNLINFC